MNVVQSEVLALMEALIIAVGNDPATWQRVAVWNGIQPKPHHCVAKILDKTRPPSESGGANG
jgi:hypothetical protein